MKKCLTLFSFLFLVGNFIFAQDLKKVDSIKAIILTQKDSALVKSYKALGRIYYPIDGFKALNYINKALSVAKTTNNKLLIADCYFHQNICHIINSEYLKCHESLDKALNIYRQIKNKDGIARIQSYRGLVQNRQGLFEASLASQMDAIKLCESNPTEIDNSILATAYLRAANIHGDIGNLEVSNSYYEKAAVIFKADNNLQELSYIKSNIATNLNDEKKYKEAIPYYKEAIAFYETNEYNHDLAMDLNNLGISYFHLDSLTKAETYYKKSLTLSESIKAEWLEALNKRSLGNIASKRGTNKLAIKYFKEALQISEKVDKKDYILNDYQFLSEAYAKNNNYKNAYAYSSKFNVLNQEILSKESLEKINELEIKYQTEKKEQQIIIQKNKIDLLNIKGKVNNQQRLLLGLGLLLALIGIYAFYQKSKRNKIAKEKAQASLEFKTKELTTHALHLAKKNEVLNDLKQKAKVLKADANADSGYQMLIQTINFDLQDDNNWENFSRYFEEVHKDFNTTAQQKYPSITANDLRFMALLKMNLTSKEIANILNISNDGIKKARQRLRKKLGINSDQSLEALVISI